MFSPDAVVLSSIADVHLVEPPAAAPTEWEGQLHTGVSGLRTKQLEKCHTLWLSLCALAGVIFNVFFFLFLHFPFFYKIAP